MENGELRTRLRHKAATPWQEGASPSPTPVDRDAGAMDWATGSRPGALDVFLGSVGIFAAILTTIICIVYAGVCVYGASVAKDMRTSVLVVMIVSAAFGAPSLIYSAWYVTAELYGRLSGGMRLMCACVAIVGVALPFWRTSWPTAIVVWLASVLVALLAYVWIRVMEQLQSSLPANRT